LILKDERAAALMAGSLREMGIAVTPILFPAVPLGSARLRLCVTAAHSIENLEFALDGFRRVRQ
jgi:glycine C-acetyltransferase